MRRSWSQLTAALDAAVFGRLADDLAAPWLRGGVELGRVPALLDLVERPATSHGGLALVETAHVVRVLIADLAALSPTPPAVGDVFRLAGRDLVVHGAPWRDDRMGGRDWLCPVNP